MRRTSIMLEFSDEVYDTLVEPMKKNKSFSKLLASLIDGYMKDEYIRAYADDTLSDLKKAAVDSFDASIDSMSESLSSLGLFTDELDVTANFGKKKFQDKAKSQRDVIEKEVDDNRLNSNTVELDNVNKRIDAMQESFNSVLTQLLEAVKTNTPQPMPAMQMPYFAYPNMMGYMPNMQNMMQMQGSPISQGMPVQGTNTPNPVTDTSVAQTNVAEEKVSVDNKAVDVIAPVVETVIETPPKDDINIYSSSDMVSSASSSFSDFEDNDATLADDFMSSMLEGNFFSV